MDAAWVAGWMHKCRSERMSLHKYLQISRTNVTGNKCRLTPRDTDSRVNTDAPLLRVPCGESKHWAERQATLWRGHGEASPLTRLQPAPPPPCSAEIISGRGGNADSGICVPGLAPGRGVGQIRLGERGCMTEGGGEGEGRATDVEKQRWRNRATETNTHTQGQTDRQTCGQVWRQTQKDIN